MVEFEPLIDSTTAVLFSRLDELFATSGNACDLREWLQFFAFDVIGKLTFSKRLGFLEKGKDVEDIIASTTANFDWYSVVGQMPILDLFLTKNPIYLKFFAQPIESPIINFGQRRMIALGLRVDHSLSVQGEGARWRNTAGSGASWCNKRITGGR